VAGYSFPLIHHTVYGLIIGMEVVIAGLCWLGGLRLSQNHKDPALFNQSKRSAILGLTLGFICGLRIYDDGGEWFLMWQSETANDNKLHSA